MMRLTLVVCLVLGLFSAASAQTVEVRSGKHESFIRLVVDLPSRIDATIENERDHATVSFENGNLKFDTSRVYRRISNEDVAAVTGSPDGGTLRIDFGCTCEVSSFWYGTSLLVLDVRERTTPFPEADPERQEEAQVLVSEEPSKPGQLITLSQGPLSLAARLAKPQLQPSLEKSKAPVPEPEAPVNSAEPPNQDVIRDTREELLKQLGRAAAQGLLSLNSNLPALQPDSPDEDSANSEPSQTQEPEPPKNGNVNLRAQSSIDRDFLSTLHGFSIANSPSACLKPADIDVSSWGTVASYAEQVGPLRRSLMGEFDKLKPEAVYQLVKTYLYFGFGAEARTTLSLLEEETNDSRLLLALSNIMETGHAPIGNPLTGQLDCDGPSALWSVLSHASLPENLPINANAAVLAFDALPKHLRSHVGPTLSRRFLDAGDTEAAEKVFRILSRSEDVMEPGANLVEAEIDLAEGQYPEAIDNLETLSEANAEPSAEALISLIDTSIETATPVSFEHAVLAGGYVQQYRGSPLEPELVRVYLIGLAASGAFDQAYKERKRLSDLLSPEVLPEMNGQLLSLLTNGADEVTFLKHIMGTGPDEHKALPPKIGNAAAERLLDVGFPTKARDLIAEEASGKIGRARQILKAKISIREGKPQQAIVDLSNIEDAEAAVLRAQAHSLAGDHLTAAQIYAAREMTANSQRQSWLAEDWSSLLSAEDSALANGAALAVLQDDTANSDGSGAKPSPSDRVLARNRGLIQQSSAARETIEEILDSNPSP